MPRLYENIRHGTKLETMDTILIRNGNEISKVFIIGGYHRTSR